MAKGTGNNVHSISGVEGELVSNGGRGLTMRVSNKLSGLIILSKG